MALVALWPEFLLRHQLNRNWFPTLSAGMEQVDFGIGGTHGFGILPPTPFETVFPCNSSACPVDQAGLKLRDLPVSAPSARIKILGMSHYTQYFAPSFGAGYRPSLILSRCKVA